MIRSLLYVPGDRPERIRKALAAGAHAVLVDLEDAVAPTAKTAARTHLQALSPDGVGPSLWVRINAAEEGRNDLAVLQSSAIRLGGVVLAKCEDVAWIDEVAAAVPAPTAIVPLVESARALRRLDGLCDHARVTQCHLGEIDLLADLGARAGKASVLLDHARAEIVAASAAALLLPPIAGVFTNIHDLDQLAASSAALADIGFAGRPALHPVQVPVINAAFEPSPDDIAQARRLVEMYDAALANGIGAAADADGRMIDEAVVRRARRLIHDHQAEPRPRRTAGALPDV